VTYGVSVLRKAQKELAALPPEPFQRLKVAISNLATNPRPVGCAKLKGQQAYRIRDGDYRAIYLINDPAKTVTVLHVGHRKDVYR
jgi:mRNA interferase RelE/StbE